MLKVQLCNNIPLIEDDLKENVFGFTSKNSTCNEQLFFLSVTCACMGEGNNFLQIW